jgi:serine/threonine protein kinase
VSVTLGRYVLQQRLAVGGMAEVFLANQTGPSGFERLCVVKRMLEALTLDPACVQMFLDEARLTAQLTHVNIAQVYDFGEANGTYFLAMEYVPGLDLHSLTVHLSQTNAFVPFGVAARILSQAATALHFAHTAVAANGTSLRLVHRDVSPQNILVSESGNVKLIDFGIAKTNRATRRTRTGYIKGKFAYMSPEQLTGGDLDRRSDIFSMGLVLYELLTNRSAAQGVNDIEVMEAILNGNFEPVERHRPNVPRMLYAILERALRRERDQRYVSAAEMAAAFERFIVQSGEPISERDLSRLVQEGRTTLQTPPEPRLAETVKLEDPIPTALVRTPAPPEPLAEDQRPTTQLESRPVRPLLGPPHPRHTPTAPLDMTTLPDVGMRGERDTIPLLPESVAPPGEWEKPTDPKAPAQMMGPALPIPQRRVWLTSFAASVVLASVATGAWWLVSHDPALAFWHTEPPAPPPAAVHLDPAPLDGALSVESSPPMSVWIDGMVRGTTPLELKLPPGVHTLEYRFESAGVSLTRKVLVQSENRRTERWAPAKGTVTFHAPPDTEVFAGPRSLGISPRAPVELYEGHYELKLIQQKTLHAVSRELDVEAGRDTTVSVAAF